MLIRIRLHPSNRPLLLPHRTALAMASLLAPSAVLAFTITLWSIASDFRSRADFFVSGGLFSHWQIWLVTSAALFVAFWLLTRYARVNRG